MKSDFQSMEDRMSTLSDKMATISASSDAINTALSSRKQQIAKLSGVHNLLKKVQPCSEAAEAIYVAEAYLDRKDAECVHPSSPFLLSSLSSLSPLPSLLPSLLTHLPSFPPSLPAPSLPFSYPHFLLCPSSPPSLSPNHTPFMHQILHFSPSSLHPHSCNSSLSCRNGSRSASTWVHMRKRCGITPKPTLCLTSTNMSSPLRESEEIARRSSETSRGRCRQDFTSHRWVSIGVN